jgi:hypothetical protein
MAVKPEAPIKQDGSGVPEYSPAMQDKDVPFKVIQGHLSR